MAFYRSQWEVESEAEKEEHLSLHSEIFPLDLDEVSSVRWLSRLYIEALLFNIRVIANQI